MGGHNLIRNKLIRLIGLVIVVIIIVGLCFVHRILPQDNGNYSINDYTIHIEYGFKPEQQYDEIQNYWDAYAVAQKVIKSRFPESNLSIFNPYYKRVIYYDTNSDTWLVYVLPHDVDVLGGAYACIISSNGTVISCWGEE